MVFTLYSEKSPGKSFRSPESARKNTKNSLVKSVFPEMRKRTGIYRIFRLSAAHRRWAETENGKSVPEAGKRELFLSGL
jgi:hypothetical protein